MPRIAITDQFWLERVPGSPRWYLAWRERGEKRRRTTGTSEIAEAKARARRLILEHAEIRDAKPAELKLVVVLDRYWEQYGSKLPSKETAARAIALWVEFWGEESTVADLTVTRQEEFVGWLRGKRYSEGYVRRVLAVGKAALNRAWKRQECTQVPFVDLPAITRDAFPHHATPEQLAAWLNGVFAQGPAHIVTLSMLVLCTGCRGDAARDLQPFQVDLRTGLIRLNPPGRAQTKKYRPVVPLTDTLRAYLATLPAAPHYVHWHKRRVKSIKTTWRKLRKKLALPAWFTPKAMRHTVATELRRRGVPGWEVSGQLGHKGKDSADTTETYAHFDPAYLGKARKALDTWMRELAQLAPAPRPFTRPARAVGRA